MKKTCINKSELSCLSRNRAVSARSLCKEPIKLFPQANNIKFTSYIYIYVYIDDVFMTCEMVILNHKIKSNVFDKNFT